MTSMMYERLPGYSYSGQANHNIGGNQRECIRACSREVGSCGGVQQGACPRQQIEMLGINTKKPRFPAYAVASVRLLSFQNGWTKPQKPHDLAKAGFFYAGYGDFVRCFFCGGGLTDWDTEDEPWVEHAHWFPECVFLKQNKGKAFVEEVQRQVEEQKHEENACTVNLTEAMTQLCLPEAMTNSEKYPTQATHGGPSPLETIAALSVLEMGYSVSQVEQAIQIWAREKDGAEFKAVDLMDILFGIEDGTISVQGPREEQTDQQPLSSDQEKVSDPSRNSPISYEEDMEETNSIEACHFAAETDNTTQRHASEIVGLQQENSRLKDLTICKICMDDVVSVAFLPCGHLATCSQCAPALRKCPICRMVVKGTVRTYLA